MYNLNVEYTYNNPILTWDSYPDAVKYNIYRGIAETNLSKIKQTNLLQYKDVDIDIRTKFDRTEYIYKISALDKNDKETFFTDKVNFNIQIPYPYRGLVKEFIRRNELMLNRISGANVDIYLKKNSGNRCPDCYNEIRKDVQGDEVVCLTCYNTTFEGGFEKISSKIRIKNAPTNIEEMSWGVQVVEGQRQGFMSVYPIVNTGDFIRTNREIFKIKEVKHREFQGIMTVQILTLELLPTSHYYYDIQL